MRRKSPFILAVVLGLVLAACSSDPTTSEEYLILEQELTEAEGQIEDLKTQLAAVTAERDEVTAGPDVPDDVLALLDDWWEANERGDGSVVDLYTLNGYHMYGSRKVARDDLATHFGAPGYSAELITEPILIANEPESRYVVTQGIRTSTGSMSFASAMTYEVKAGSDGLKIVHSDWSHVTP